MIDEELIKNFRLQANAIFGLMPNIIPSAYLKDTELSLYALESILVLQFHHPNNKEYLLKIDFDKTIRGSDAILIKKFMHKIKDNLLADLGSGISMVIDGKEIEEC